jgi:glucose-1-phosphate thymidylyltransferase
MHKGIILAGGLATRLYPCTKVISKHLLPIYDKPMIFYSLSTLMLSGVKDILIITDRNNVQNYKKLLGYGNSYGVKIDYEMQNKPEGIAQAFLIGEKFIRNESCTLILGDNFFYGHDLSRKIKRTSNLGAKIFLHPVKNPEKYGVAKIKKKKIIKIIEKPKKYVSNLVVTGLYHYDKNVVKYCKLLKKSKRNEYEITDLNNIYLKNNKLKYEILGRGYTWLDAGSFDDLLDVSLFVRTIQHRQGNLIGKPEEVAINQRLISKK